MGEKESMRFAVLKARVAAWRAEFDPEAVTRYLREHCADEVKLCLRRADQLMDQEFVFLDLWDMEPCGKGYLLTPMRWDCAPNGDPEWVYMLNRHDWMHKLFWAWRLTGEMSYIEKLKWYLFEWISDNPIEPGGGETIRTIDTGIRCKNWAELLLGLIADGLISEEETGQILYSMAEQFGYLENAYIPKYTLSNWGLLQTSAMCLAYLWYRDYLPKNGLEEWAWGELKEQLELQVMEDGSHWEQSIMYHMEVLNSCMYLWTSCNWAGKKVPGWLTGTVERMSRYVLWAAGSDHRQLAQADSDVTDVRDVLTRSATLCGSPAYKSGGFSQMDLDSSRLLGWPGIRRYGAIKREPPGNLSLVCKDTGNIYLRSSWEETASYTYLHCGPLGSAHGHGDLTQLCLYYRGAPFVVDSGRYSYREDEPLRAALKEAGAHNVCRIDGRSQAVADGSWSYRSYGECLRSYFSERGPVHFVEMGYHGTLGDGELCLVKRRVMVHDAGVWLVVNDICCKGNHTAEEFYHLDGRVKVHGGENGREMARASWILEAGGVRLGLMGSNLFCPENCRISSRYGELEDSRRLVKRTEFSDRLTDWTVFAGEGISAREVPVYRAGSGEPVARELVTSMEFMMGGGESWVFLIFNRETFAGPKLYFCKQVPVYARAAALHFSGGVLKERFRL